jgi:hypothetical protein
VSDRSSTTKAASRSLPTLLVELGAHEWVSFADPCEERTWVFDVTFLESRWTCIYGRGCQGVLTAPAPELAQGCCSYGAHFTGEDDAQRVAEAAETLTDEQWQHRRTARKKGGPVVRTRSGSLVTRIVDGACVFLNRPSFPGGPGCALHRAALERGVPPRALKPDVCWQLPLRREDAEGAGGRVTSVVGQWGRAHWGRGGEEFHWWCTEAPDAFVGTEPVYRALKDELVALVGERPYRILAAYLDARTRRLGPLPHPAAAPVRVGPPRRR